MSGNLVLAGLVAIVVGAALYLFAWPYWQRRRVLSRPFPERWDAILQRQLPIYDQLQPALRQQLQRLIQWFLHRKQFVGCAGQEITDEIRLSVAGQACLLLLNRPTTEYADLRSIYVYPSSFIARRQMADEVGLVSTHADHLIGESWDTGKVILAWDEVARGARDFTDGHNVVLHEFAHQLDHETGITNGAPLLADRRDYALWSEVFSREFERLQQRDPGDPGVIDPYGATDPAEFFAVATETFFEEPVELHRHHRDLYEQLVAYYRLDPRQWVLK